MQIKFNPMKINYDLVDTDKQFNPEVLFSHNCKIVAEHHFVTEYLNKPYDSNACLSYDNNDNITALHYGNEDGRVIETIFADDFKMLEEKSSNKINKHIEREEGKAERFIIKNESGLKKAMEVIDNIKFHIDDVFDNGSLYEIYAANDEYLEDYYKRGGMWSYDNSHEDVKKHLGIVFEKKITPEGAPMIDIDNMGKEERDAAIEPFLTERRALFPERNQANAALFAQIDEQKPNIDNMTKEDRTAAVKKLSDPDQIQTLE